MRVRRDEEALRIDISIEGEWVSTERHLFLITWPVLVPVPPLTWPTTVLRFFFFTIFLGCLFAIFYFLHHLHHRLFLCFCCPLNATGTTHTLRHFGVFRCVWFAFILLQLARYIKEKSIRFPRYLSPSLYILFSFSIVASFCFPLT